MIILLISFFLESIFAQEIQWGFVLENFEASLTTTEAKLTKSLGTDVKLTAFPNASLLKESFKKGELDFALMSPFSAVGVEKLGRIIARAPYPTGNFLHGVVLVKKNSDLNSKKFKARSIVWNGLTSASAHVVPLVEMMKEFKSTPNQLFKKEFFDNDPASALKMLLSGQVDMAAFTAYSSDGSRGTWEHGLKAEQKSQVKAFFVTKKIPGPALVMASDSEFARNPDKLISAIRSLKKQDLGELGVTEFVAADSKDYDNIRQATKLVEQTEYFNPL